MTSKNALQDSNQKTLKSNQINLLKRLKNLFKVLKANIKDHDLWCLIPCLIFALIATFYKPYFFIFCIIVFIIYSKSLMEIVLALWVPKYRILWTIILTMGVIYIYSVISLTMFRNDFSQNISNSWESVFDCYVTIVDQWYKNNGLGGFLSTNVPAISLNNKFNINWGRFTFDLIFFIIVPTLLINLIFGIIIDNFAERRAKRDNLKKKTSYPNALFAESLTTTSKTSANTRSTCTTVGTTHTTSAISKVLRLKTSWIMLMFTWRKWLTITRSNGFLATPKRIIKTSQLFRLSMESPAGLRHWRTTSKRWRTRWILFRPTFIIKMARLKKCSLSF